jgi:ribosomal protein L7/L12
MIDLPHTIAEIPVQALEALRAGRKLDAIRIVRETSGVDLETAKARVDAALAVEAKALPARSPASTAVLDYLAGSMKFPLACALGAGSLGLWIGIEYLSAIEKQMDSGLFMLMMLGVPMIVTAAGLMIWARRWKKMRNAEEAQATTSPPPARARFGGLPDPGMPAAAVAALDRGETITAIKVLREELGLGLAEAKARIDAELAKRR